MSPNNNSSSWYRIADVKPRVQDHITIHRHEYRHHAWFILQDRHKGRSHRFNATAYFIISCMNGNRSMQELFEITCTKFSDTAPSQDEFVSLLGKLYMAELIHTDKMPDMDELANRTETLRRQKFKQYFMNPLSMRFPLFNPDKTLNRMRRFVRPLFRKKILYIWYGLMAIAFALTLTHWPELSSATRLHTFTTQNMILLILIYPLIKLIHEFGHACAIKFYGGEVNEMGIMLMIFIPVPYVNAHSATAFTDKSQRMLVSAMGIIIELSLAAIALIVWLLVEPGLLRSICLDIMLIGGISTLLINGNPLLKFDGYHILADAIEAPNLASRSKKYLSYKLHEVLFKIDKGDSGIISDSERTWFISYAVAAFIYRIFLTLFILSMVLEKFFAAGILLAGWAVSMQFVLPLLRYIKYLTSSEQISQNRQRVYSVVGAVTLVLVITLFVIPVSQTSSTQGIIWLAEERQIKASAPGFVRQLLAENNSIVTLDQALVTTEDPLLAGRVKVLRARLRELKIQHHSKQDEHLEREQLKQEIETVQADLELQQQRLSSLILRSPADGLFIMPTTDDLTDQFVEAGQVVGFILDPAYIVAQIIISEQEIALFQQETSQFEIRPVGQPDRIIPAKFKRLVPEAIKQLPSAALGVNGGGPILVDPADPDGLKTIEKVFQIELSLPANEFTDYIGSRILVRVKHNSQPLAWQWGRSLQQLLLGRFNA